jgi:hypothetical protein
MSHGKVDDCPKRTPHVPESFAMIKRHALALWSLQAFVAAVISIALATPLVPGFLGHRSARAEDQALASPESWFTKGLKKLNEVLDSSMELQKTIEKIHDLNSKIIAQNQINDLLQILSNLEDSKQKFTSRLSQDIRTGDQHYSNFDPEMRQIADDLRKQIDVILAKIKNFLPLIDQMVPTLRDDLYKGLQGKSEYATEILKGSFCDEHGENCHKVDNTDIVKDGQAAIGQIHHIRDRLNEVLKAIESKSI